MSQRLAHGCYVALPLPPALRGWFTALQAGVRSAPGAARAQDPSGAHLTLRYFGALEPAQVERVSALVRALAAQRAPLELEVAGWDCFDQRGAAQVLHLVVAETLQLRALADAVRTLPFGAPAADPFRPHLTVLRVRDAARFAPTLATLRAGLQPRRRFTAARLQLLAADAQGAAQAVVVDAPLQLQYPA